MALGRVLRCPRCGPTYHSRRESDRHSGYLWRCESCLLSRPSAETTLEAATRSTE